MISELDAFLLGYLPATLGTYYNSVELIAALDQRPEAELALRVQRRQQDLGVQEAQVGTDLQKVQALLAAAALPVPVTPASPPQYHGWCGQIFTTVQGQLRGEPLLGALHMVGFILADTWVTLTLSGLVSYFLAASPQDPWLTAQAAALFQEQEKVQRQLGKAATHPLWTDAQRQAVQEILAALGQAPKLDADPEQRLVALPPVMERLSAAMSALQGSLT